MSALTPEIMTGMPAGTKARPRADFRPNEFDQAITTKGYKMWWSRAGICPCLNNDVTEQADPNCGLCEGRGKFYFLPDEALVAGATQDGEGNSVRLNPEGNAVQIYVLMTSLTQDIQIFEKFGEWVFGTARATTQAPNRLGYGDRLIAVESEMVWSQIIEYAGGTTIPIVGALKKTGLRYPFTGVHHFRSLSTVYRAGVDYALTSQGAIEWLSSRPASGTRLSIHGRVHPHWVVLEHVNTYRDTRVAGGTTALSDQVHVQLPVQMMCKLDFLVTPGET